ncbi:MAG: flagellar protein FlgN [Bacillota bacterium]|nr:flagellar protein FlgN [Bacillota bacterium]
MDNQMINDLVKVLEQESGLYKEILNISKNKTNIIIEGKIAELESVVKLEQSIVFQMGRLEDTREQLVEKLSKELGMDDPSQVTLSQLIKYVDDNSLKDLRAYQDGMTRTINELKNCNEVNSRLIRNSLDYINFSINLLTEVGSVNNGYGNTGMGSDSKKRNLFDVKL